MMKKLALLSAAAVALALISLGIASASHVTGVTIDSATLNADGSLTVTGTVSCNDGAVNSTSVNIQAVQGATNQNANSTVFSPCPVGGATYNYSVTLPGPYMPGSVTVTATTDCCDDATNSVPLTDTQSFIVAVGQCPSGDNWAYQLALGPDDPFDKNGDGVICTKNLPVQSSGQGNSANRNGGADAGHVDGHNHKDNNN